MQEVAVPRQASIPRLGRFAWLMGLYAENFRRMTRLFEPVDLAPGRYVSSTGNRLDVPLDRVYAHAHTTELRLYRDARQAEATHCYVGRRWQDVIGMYPPAAEVVDHRMRMNTFLGKWLEYLAEGGHGVATLRLVEGAGHPVAPPAFVGTARK